MPSSLHGSPELLMSSIIKKRKKKMNKHKWKKRRRLVRYKNKPWFIRIGYFSTCDPCNCFLWSFCRRLCILWPKSSKANK
jgi:hypothetical protein